MYRLFTFYFSRTFGLIFEEFVLALQGRRSGINFLLYQLFFFYFYLLQAVDNCSLVVCVQQFSSAINYVLHLISKQGIITCRKNVSGRLSRI